MPLKCLEAYEMFAILVRDENNLSMYPVYQHVKHLTVKVILVGSKFH